MKAAVQPFVDARNWQATERRAARVSFESYDALFTASWDRPSSLVPRPDGLYRRKYLVTLLVTAEHRERPFQQIQLVTLYLAGGVESLITDDIGDVHARDLSGVTLSIYIDDWHPRERASGVIVKPWRRLIGR